MAEPRLVAGAARRQRHVLGVHRSSVRPGERVVVTERAADGSEDLPIGAGLARRGQGRAHPRDASLGVRHRALLLRPLGGGEEVIGEAPALGRIVGVLDDHELGAVERAGQAGRVREAHERVRRNDPDGLDPARLEPGEEVARHEPGRGGELARSQAPGALHLVAVLRPIDQR